MAYGLRGVLAAAVGGLMLPALASAQSAYWFRHVDGVQHLADFGDAVAHGPAGTVSLAGTSRDTNDSWTLVTVRYAADGTRLWTRTYRGTPSGFHNDSAVDVGVDAAGNTYTLGSSWGGLRPAGSEFDYVLIKYAPTGEQEWVRRYNGPGNWSDMPQALEVDAAGNCYIAGFAFFQPDLLSRYATDFHVIKYTSAGAIAWQYNTNTGATGNLGAGARDIALDPSGNVYATGVIQGGDQWNTNNDFLTVKLTNDGELVYRRTYSSPGFNTGMDDGKVITADAAGNAYVAGYWMPGEATERHLDTRTIKYSPAGELLWTASTDRPREEGAQGIAVDAQGNVFVAGGWLAATENNGFLNAYGPTGTPLWDYVLDEPGDWDENWFVDVKVGPDGNVWAGADNQRETGYDPTLVKFSPSGEVLLRESYDAGSNSDSTFAFDVDELGNAYFGGHSYFPATSSDLLTLKVPGTLPPPTCPADFDTSGQVNTSDISAFLSEWFVDVAGTGLASDFNADGVANTADVSAFLSAWFAALSGGCR